MIKQTRYVYIFDLDGTLANNEHRSYYVKEHPKDWDTWHKLIEYDTVFIHIRDLADILYLSGREIVYVTGRSDICREATQNWLSQYCPPGPLYMRREGDHRDDNIIKIEILAQMREDGYEPIMVFDDRTRVVNAWRAAGVPCAQVAPGDF